MSSRMGMDQDDFYNILTAAKLVGNPSLKEEQLKRLGLCRRYYGKQSVGTRKYRVLWFALLVDGDEPREAPDQQDGKNPAKPMPAFESRSPPTGQLEELGYSIKRRKDDEAAATTRRSPEKEPERPAQMPMVKDPTKVTVVGKKLFESVKRKRDELERQVALMTEARDGDAAAATAELEAERQQLQKVREELREHRAAAAAAAEEHRAASLRYESIIDDLRAQLTLKK